MNKMKKKRVTIFILVAAMIGVMVPTHSAATNESAGNPEAAQESVGSVYVGPTPVGISFDDGISDGPDALWGAGAALWGNCEADAMADWIHISSDRDARKASVHTYWYHISGECEPKLRVEARLYQWQCYTDMSDCWWEPMGQRAQNVKPSTSHKKYNVVVKRNCRTSDLTSWLVDVKVTIPRRFWFDRHAYYTRTDDIDCRV